MRLSTTIKKKIIPHICQTWPRNAGTAEFATMNCPRVSILAYPICTATCQRLHSKPTLPMSERITRLCGRAVANSRQCSLEEDR